jgi:hypothetical protein
MVVNLVSSGEGILGRKVNEKPVIGAHSMRIASARAREQD